MSDRDDKPSPACQAPVLPVAQVDPATLAGEVAALSRVLRAELAAVEAYDAALVAARDQRLAAPLGDLRDRHDRRVVTLAGRIRALGGQPPDGSGAWGLLARSVQHTADLVGDAAALASLARGEEHGSAIYARTLASCDAVTRQFLRSVALPDQERTRAICQALAARARAA